MTTTAEKIEALQARMKALEKSLTIYKRDLEGLQQDIRPADPEPLERWVNFYTGQSADTAWPSEKVARTHAVSSPTKIAVHMRQVTPQDGQDRLDAEKYRLWAKFVGEEGLEETLKNAARFRRLVAMAGVAWQPGDTEWCQAVPGNLLREEIDKAMEGE